MSGRDSNEGAGSRLSPDPAEETTRHGPTGLRSLAIDTGPLRRHPQFRLLLAARAITSLGSMSTYVTVPFHVYTLTHSTLAVGLLAVAEIIPLVLSGLLGGALADAFDRRRIIVTTEVGLLAGSGILIANGYLRHPHVWLLFVWAAIASAIGGLQRPAIEAMLPKLVDPSELTSMASIRSMISTLTQIGGPALGGLIIAGVGIRGAYVFDAITFAFSLVLLVRLRPIAVPAEADGVSLQGIADGWRFARSSPVLMGTYVVDIVAMVFGMPIAVFPALAADYGGPRTLGLLYAAPAVGAFIATLTSGWSNRVQRHGLGVIISAAIWGVAIALFGFAGFLPLALVLLAIAGGADMMSGIFRMTIWNRTVPDELRGRLASIEMLSYSTGPILGNLETGAVATAFTPRVSIVSGGVLCVVGTAVLALALPTFTAYRDRGGSWHRDRAE